MDTTTARRNTDNNIIVCSPINGQCVKSSVSYTAKLILIGENFENKTPFEFPITFKSLDIKHKVIDVILGYHDIKEFDLIRRLMSRFCQAKPDWGLLGSDQPAQNTPLRANTGNPNSEGNWKAVVATLLPQESITLDTDGDEMFRESSQTWDFREVEEKDVLDGMIIAGSPFLRRELTRLVNEYKDIFSRTLTATPAQVPPLEIQVDTTRWHSSASHLPPRLQGVVKGEEIRIQTTQMLGLNLIQPSQEAHYSQVHLVRKADRCLVIHDRFQIVELVRN
jgi:hypothetical protein